MSKGSWGCIPYWKEEVKEDQSAASALAPYIERDLPAKDINDLRVTCKSTREIWTENGKDRKLGKGICIGLKCQHLEMDGSLELRLGGTEKNPNPLNKETKENSKT